MATITRRHNFQTISWFWDLHTRSLLDLDPPYQRRSVWNQEYKDHFIDTILLGYPAPAIFLYEDLDPSGRAIYNVVDGKQRLVSILQFIQNEFPVSERAEKASLRGLYFRDLDDVNKREFWSYQLLVEYVPTTNEDVIDNIFNRINKNVARLTAQELRHAKFGGAFINAAEGLSEWMQRTLPLGFPNIASQSRKQMKDVELAATLLLLLDEGIKGYSQIDLDKAFSDRDEQWETEQEVTARFRLTIQTINRLINDPDSLDLARTRIRNQADFYSLFGAVAQSEGEEVDTVAGARRLLRFMRAVEDPQEREVHPELRDYYDAARSASNDAAPRSVRIKILTSVLKGEISWLD